MKNKLTKSEKKIWKGYQKGEWKSKGGKAVKSYLALAKKQIKEERINIRLPEETVEKIRREAFDVGMPYQTLIASVLYRYAHDQLYNEKQIRQALKLFRR